jgi:hypothetical protein
VLPYDSPSGPLFSSSVQENISTLRHLARLTDSGIITGRVTRMEMTDDEKLHSVPVPDWGVTAKPVSGGTEYNALTDSDGHFEFELPRDRYNVTANTQRRVWAPDGETFTIKHGCVDVDFLTHADGGIAEIVTTADGKPAPNAQVAILRTSPRHAYFTVAADGQGHFEVRGQEPGRYVVQVSREFSIAARRRVVKSKN